jgi:protein-S-isoprenylcysteine O-methyltransferase Ste14
MSTRVPEQGEVRSAHDAASAGSAGRAPVEPARAAAFRDDMAAMRVQDSVARRDRMIKIGSVVVMTAAAILGVIAIAMSSGTDSSLDQGDAIVMGLYAVTLAIIGAAVFVRYSLASFLRFWMARLTFEQSTQTDRVVDALRDTPDGGS